MLVQVLMDSSAYSSDKLSADCPSDMIQVLSNPSFRDSVANTGTMASRPNGTVSRLVADTREGIGSFKECAQMLQALYVCFMLEV